MCKDFDSNLILLAEIVAFSCRIPYFRTNFRVFRLKSEFLFSMMGEKADRNLCFLWSFSDSKKQFPI